MSSGEPVGSDNSLWTGTLDEAMARLRQLVLDDDAICQKLRVIPDRAAFRIAAAAIAQEHGLDLTPADIEAALVSARRQWLERWV